MKIFPLYLLSNRIKHLFVRCFCPDTHLIADCRKYGLKFKFHALDGVGRDIYYKYGVYSEDDITEFLLKTLNITDSDIILDVGANLGWYSLTLSHAANPAVFAFEPEPHNYQLLSDNIKLNGKTNIHPQNMAVDKTPGTKTLYLYKKCNLGRHSLIKSRKSVGSVEVEATTIDAFAARQLQGKRIKLLKIDTEGNELNVLLGAKATLPQIDNILSEFSPAIISGLNQNPRDFIDLLEQQGFKPSEISDEGRLTVADIPAMLQNPAKARNIFWTRNHPAT
ncbi:MAG: FkbM family methyltransferase [Elusimicrobiales bacterium]